MEPAVALSELERLAERLGIEVRREAMPVAGGLCRVRGRWVLYVNSTLSTAERVEVMVEALRGLDLSGVYVRPALRQLLEPSEDAEPPSER